MRLKPVVLVGAISVALVQVGVVRVASAQGGPCFEGVRYRLTLNSDFTAGSSALHQNGGKWLTRFPWGRDNHTGGDAAYYLDPANDLGAGTVAFRGPAGLALTARPVAAASQSHIDGYAYASGLVTTGRSSGAPTFAQRYGYYEVRAKFPGGAGLWPAFWLRDSLGGTAELDVFEFLGDDRSSVYQSVHYASGTGASYRFHPAFDPTAGFHDYGVLVTPSTATYYVDGSATHSVADPSTHAFYFILSMQVGAAASWPGPPDPSTHWPATLTVKYFHAFEPAGSTC